MVSLRSSIHVTLLCQKYFTIKIVVTLVNYCTSLITASRSTFFQANHS